MDLTCSNCHRKLRVPESADGQRIRCPQCQTIQRVAMPVGASRGSSNGRWYLKTPDGRDYGPVPFDELSAWGDEGRISGDCMVFEDGSPQWHWAGEVLHHIPRNGAARKASPPPRTNGQRVGTSARPLATSQRSRLVAGLLGLIFPFMGLCGIQRLYLGHIAIGVIQLLTFGLFGIWQLIDVVLIFAGSVTDVDGLPLRD